MPPPPPPPPPVSFLSWRFDCPAGLTWIERQVRIALPDACDHMHGFPPLPPSCFLLGNPLDRLAKLTWIAYLVRGLNNVAWGECYEYLGCG